MKSWLLKNTNNKKFARRPIFNFGEINSKTTDFNFEWKINLSDQVINRQRTYSPPFITHCFNKEVKWCLQFYPKGFRKNVEKILSIGLKNLSNFKITAECLLEFSNEDNGRSVNWVIEKGLFREGYCRGLHFMGVNGPDNLFLVGTKMTVKCRIFTHIIINPDGKSFTKTNEFDN